MGMATRFPEESSTFLLIIADLYVIFVREVASHFKGPGLACHVINRFKPPSSLIRTCFHNFKELKYGNRRNTDTISTQYTTSPT